MTDLAGNSDENSALEALSRASKQPLELDVEGKRFGQALLGPVHTNPFSNENGAVLLRIPEGGSAVGLPIKLMDVT